MLTCISNSFGKDEFYSSYITLINICVDVRGTQMMRISLHPFLILESSYKYIHNVFYRNIQDRVLFKRKKLVIRTKNFSNIYSSYNLYFFAIT